MHLTKRITHLQFLHNPVLMQTSKHARRIISTISQIWFREIWLDCAKWLNIIVKMYYHTTNLIMKRECECNITWHYFPINLLCSYNLHLFFSFVVVFFLFLYPHKRIAFSITLMQLLPLKCQRQKTDYLSKMAFFFSFV